MVVVSSILIPDSSSTWAPLFTCTTEHFFFIPVEADVLHRSSSLFQHSVQLALGGSKNLEVVDIQDIGDFDSYRLG